MAFNSNTYYQNKHRREAWAQLKHAREVRDRVRAGTAYDWEAPHVALFARLARLSMKISLSYRSIKRI